MFHVLRFVTLAPSSFCCPLGKTLSGHPVGQYNLNDKNIKDNVFDIIRFGVNQ